MAVVVHVDTRMQYLYGHTTHTESEWAMGIIAWLGTYSTKYAESPQVRLFCSRIDTTLRSFLGLHRAIDID